jgi:hypothetical protein
VRLVEEQKLLIFVTNPQNFPSSCNHMSSINNMIPAFNVEIIVLILEESLGAIILALSLPLFRITWQL